MKRVWVVLCLFGCLQDPLGRPCETDNQCGPGYDCFQNVCYQVCTKDEQCRDAKVCQRFHCVSKEEAPHTAATTPGPGSAPPPPIPDATMAELRAIRRHLELVREENKQILEKLEKLTKPLR